MSLHQKTMYKHFSNIAPSYKTLRTTDMEPILFIKNKLKGITRIEAADIGCGDGRYCLLLCRLLNNLHLTCIDINKTMLEEAHNYLKGNGIINFKTMESDANEIPLEDNSMDCIFTFNAIHHFDFKNLMKNAGMIIKNTGFFFIYTRLQEQNTISIWGKHFPLFLEKENRLYDLNTIKSMMNSTNPLTSEYIKTFKYNRTSTLGQLINKVRGRHYSTFSLYEEDELEDCIKHFKENIIVNFHDTDNIEWIDENIIFVLRHYTH